MKERERERERLIEEGGGAEREMETQNPKQAPGPDVGLKLTDRKITKGAEVGRLTN